MENAYLEAPAPVRPSVRPDASRSHMSRALDGTEKITLQKLGHPMLVQPILSQKNQKSKFFNEQFFCN